MSKSKGNGVAPRDMAAKYGVDTLRMAIMFGAPPENDLNFDEKQLKDMKSFLDKVARMGDKIKEIKVKEIDLKNKAFGSIIDLLIDYEVKINDQRYFHVAIARLMEIANIVQKRINERDESSIIMYALLLRSLYPFSPHLTSELWRELC